jgi:hypothetical protein
MKWGFSFGVAPACQLTMTQSETHVCRGIRRWLGQHRRLFSVGEGEYVFYYTEIRWAWARMEKIVLLCLLVATIGLLAELSTAHSRQ